MQQSKDKNFYYYFVLLWLWYKTSPRAKKKPSITSIMICNIQEHTTSLKKVRKNVWQTSTKVNYVNQLAYRLWIYWSCSSSRSQHTWFSAGIPTSKNKPPRNKLEALLARQYHYSTRPKSSRRSLWNLCMLRNHSASQRLGPNPTWDRP